MTLYPENVWYRLLLMAPYAVLLVFGVALVVAAVDAHGVIQDAGYRPETAMLGGLIVALPAIAYGLWALLAVWRRTSMTYAPQGYRMAFGLLPLAGICECLGWYAVLIGDVNFYFQPNFGFDSEFESKPVVTVTEFYILAFFAAFVFPNGIFGVLSKVLYVDGIRDAGEPEVEGPDPMGKIARTGGAFPTR